MLENGFLVSYVQIVLCHIDHSIGKAPFVVEPDEKIEQMPTADPGLAGIDDSRVRVVIEVDRGMRRLRVGKQAPQAADSRSLQQLSGQLDKLVGNFRL